MVEVGLPGQGAGLVRIDGYKTDITRVLMQKGGVSDPITALAFASDIYGDLINHPSVTYKMPFGEMTFTTLPEPKLGLQTNKDPLTIGLWLVILGLFVASLGLL